MVYESLEAAKLLEKWGVHASVINMHTLKPLDNKVVEKAIFESPLIVTIEEHSIIGGLGSAVAECKSSYKNAPPQLTLGLPDIFGKVGEHRYLLEKYGLVADQIAKKIILTIKQFN